MKIIIKFLFWIESKIPFWVWVKARKTFWDKSFKRKVNFPNQVIFFIANLIESPILRYQIKAYVVQW